MNLRLSQVLTEEVIQALQQAGFDVVRIGEAPAHPLGWRELCRCLRNFTE